MDADSEYLKKNVGAAVAAGLAAVAAAHPEDPIQYLADFLFKHHENQEREAARLARGKKLAEERIAYKDELRRQQAEQEAEEARQREEEERIRHEKEARITQQADEYIAMVEEATAQLHATRTRQKEHPDEIDPDEEVIGPTTASRKRYDRAVRALEDLDLKKSLGRDLGRAEEAPPRSVHKVIKAVLYMTDHRRMEIRGWENCRKILKDYQGLLANIVEYEASGIQGRRRFARVRRLFNKLDMDAVKRFSFAMFLLYEWVVAAVAVYRDVTIQRKRLAKRGDDISAADLEEEEELNKDEDEDEAEEKDLSEPEFSDDEDMGPEPEVDLEDEDEDDRRSQGSASGISDLDEEEYDEDDE